MSQITVGIVLLPDKKTESYIKKLSRKVPGNRIHFGAPALVHLSLLHIVINNENVEPITCELDRLKLSRQCRIVCYEVLRQANGWCFVEVGKSKALAAIQQSVLPLTKLRSANTPFSWRTNASLSQRRAHERYGYPNVGDAWKAHFTFGVAEERRRQSRRSIARAGFLDRFALAEIGDHGSAIRILYERKL